MKLHEVTLTGDGLAILTGEHREWDAWVDDGRTVGPLTWCDAYTAKSAYRERCPKLAVVELDIFSGLRPDKGREARAICGGHFGVHRDGKELRVRW